MSARRRRLTIQRSGVTGHDRLQIRQAPGAARSRSSPSIYIKRYLTCQCQELNVAFERSRGWRRSARGGPTQVRAPLARVGCALLRCIETVKVVGWWG